MISISDVNELNKILRTELITQSELEGKFVRNALDIHGQDLDKLLEAQVYSSIDTSDVLLLFQLHSRDSNSDISQTLENDTILIYTSYTLYCILYGNESNNVANKIVARFRTDEVRDDLYAQGVYLEEITNPKTFDEFKNETMWQRADFEINVSCQREIKPVTEGTEITDIDNLQIIKTTL